MIFSHIITNPAVRAIALSAGLLFSALSGSAGNIESKTQERESIFPAKSLSLAFSHFTWGAEVGSSIDLTGYDLSTIDVDVLFGYKNSFIRMAGFGAGVHRSVHRGDNFIPVYASIQTSFRSRPSLCFLKSIKFVVIERLIMTLVYIPVAAVVAGIAVFLSKVF